MGTPHVGALRAASLRRNDPVQVQRVSRIHGRLSPLAGGAPLALSFAALPQAPGAHNRAVRPQGLSGRPSASRGSPARMRMPSTRPQSAPKPQVNTVTRICATPSPECPM
jgi:hypothetical protein